MNGLWDARYNYQEQLNAVESATEFDTLVEELKRVNEELFTLQKRIDEGHAAREALNAQAQAADGLSYLEELKGASDYRAEYVRQLGNAITAEKAKKTAAAGTDDEDLVTAEVDAVVAFYEE